MLTVIKERWISVFGYEGLYEVSDLGNVRSLRSFTLHKNGKPFLVEEGVLHPSLDRDGYPLVLLCKDSKEWVHQVHRLVLRAFVGPRPEGKLVRHENGCRIDNRLDNLVYGTPKQNGEDKAKHRPVAGENHPGAKLNEIAIQDIVTRGSTRKHGIFSQLAREYGVSHVTISNIVNGKYWTDVTVEGVSREDLKKKRLTEDTVREIKKDLNLGGRGVTNRLAQKYNVSHQLISAIKNGTAWSHVTIDDEDQQAA